MTERKQVRPAAEGWTQAKDETGKPLLQFAEPKRKQPPVHLADLSIEERAARVKELGIQGFRAKQLSTHYFTHYTSNPADMTDLPAAGREELVGALLPPLLTEVKRLQTDKGDTIKFLWRLFDGALVESVLMRYTGRITLCISSQAGCGMNCPFCATGQAGLTRNMSAGEIVDQIVRANQAIARGELGGRKVKAGDAPERVSNIVFMGMGEPLLNYKHVLKSIEKISDPEALGMSPKRITVSTAGVAKMIKQLGDDQVKFKLALSLHAPTDAQRNQIMPINETNDLESLIEALNYFYQKTKNEITLEYILFKNINDSTEDANQLVKVFRKIPADLVNIIEYNTIEQARFQKPDDAVVASFMQQLSTQRVNARLRRSRGKDIDAACGQLANVKQN